jgi:hypothetical protein
MSYLVLARKYRPRSFDALVGQEHVVRTLRNAIAQSRLAHAYLFVGPRGTGKTSTARIFAKALCAKGGPSIDFDPDDELSIEIAEGRCMDVLEIDGASNTGVEQVRELLGREDGAPPPVDLDLERRTGDFVRARIVARTLTCVHDLSDGGLAIGAAEMALASGVGVTLDATSPGNAHPFLFGEDQARYLIATDAPEALLKAAADAGLHAGVVGRAGGDAFASRDLFSIPLARLRAAHEDWMPGCMG